MLGQHLTNQVILQPSFTTALRPILFCPPRVPLEQRYHYLSGGQGPQGSEKLQILSDLNTCPKAWPQSSGHPTSDYWVIKSDMARADTDQGQKACRGHPVFMTDTCTSWQTKIWVVDT